ncbi:DUF934 domain-containing protein [Azospirillum sp.]|uniref:DUF934 domain-containing protein n=1 Tax=Azospirillum sp. TaxID=34012 RepID=UPI002D3636E1|nr:DUF934 domain-containing protein [Azospirillum sp.]HYD67208.1 DUF934 domain-containing protein [Azospirillum sp.]
MALLKEGQPAEDTWTHVTDDAPVPANGAITVSAARWAKERQELAGRSAPLGVRLGSADRPESVAADLGRFALVTVDFPKFRDGRGFTTARTLREHYGHTGEIRAIGHVLPDQYQMLRRCGFDSVVVPEGADLAVWAAAHTQYTVAYQAAVGDEGGPLSLLRRRFAKAG